jgi:putative transposase
VSIERLCGRYNIDLKPQGKNLVEEFRGVPEFRGHQQFWQHSNQVLARLDKRKNAAINRYNAFIPEGVGQGRRPDLTGGGLIRSAGGWVAVKAMRKANMHVKSDERILVDGDFVAQILTQANESLETKYALRANGMNLQRIAERVAELCDIPVEALWREGRYRRLVIARSLLCFWAVRELGISMTSLAGKLNISTAAVSKAVKRGAEIADEEGYKLV